ncbi:copper chaperone PCu(A)C [Shimia sp. R9_1]|uniref:copper chaperone PCu(A)C n=1 Tax=Shimia sp. R9_1 TaxID=2821111 RepID=UPI001ADB9A99|nr:copper chaperone PCu(A)C [Shimia sp. R9_1]MBO9408193.1 copper chaperone PCu(A)C [Shimia sp. R9_1]
MKARKPLGLFLIALCVSGAAWTLMRPEASNDVLLTNATAAPLVDEDKAVAVFLKIANNGHPDRLISVSAPDAEKAIFSGQDTRRAIPADSAVSLAADGMFVHLKGVSGALNDGRTLPVSLTFENAGTLNTRARIVAPRTTGEAPDFGLFGIGDICRVGEGEPAPEIALSATQNGERWVVQVLSQDFEFTPHLVDGPHVPGTGHGHIYLNGMKLGRLYEPSITIGALPPGEHDIRVTLSTNDHRAYVVGDQPISAAIRILAD